MANANITPIQVTNTFDEWRVATNDLIQDRNILRNKVYVKDESDFQLANGALTLSRSTGGVLLTVTGSGGALIGGTTTTSDLIVQDDASVANNLTVTGNVIASGNVGVGRNVNIAMELAVTGNVSVNVDKFTIDSNTGDTSIKGDLLLDGGDLVSTPNANVVNTSSNNVNFGGAAEVVRVGSTTGTTVLRGKANVGGAANLLFGANVTGDLAVSNTLIVTANGYFESNVNVAETIYVNGIVASEFKNVTVSNIATIDNAFITTLTLTNPIQSLGTGANSWALRMGSSSDGEGFFRIQRSVASGNVDIFWDETDDTWKLTRNYPSYGNERANLSATLKSVRDFIINTNATATQTVDLSTSNWFRFTVNTNTVFQFANAPAEGVGITATILVNQDASGNRGITWGNSVYWANGIAPTASANANTEDMWTFTTYDGGQSFLGTLAIKDSHLKTAPDGVIEYLVVGGGGGGGMATWLDAQRGGGGGGGGGGVRTGVGLNVSTNTTYTITVGAGGVAGNSRNLPATTPGSYPTASESSGANGANSIIAGPSPFSNVIAAGGGFGGTDAYAYLLPSNTFNNYGANGMYGGSGGGGAVLQGGAMLERLNLSSTNLPWDSGLPYNYSIGNRFIIFGGNTTINTAQTAWIYYYDVANNNFYMPFADEVGNYEAAGLGGRGNIPATSPSQGNDGGRPGLLYTDNAHSTVVNSIPGFLGSQTQWEALFPFAAFGTPQWYRFEESQNVPVGIVGGQGRGGGGGAGGVGEDGPDLKIGPPYGGLYTYGSDPSTPSSPGAFNPVVGVPPTILAGAQRGGNGGIGITSTITGTSVTYAGGGGGYGYSTRGRGGAGGGGDSGTGGYLTYTSRTVAPGSPWTGNNAVIANNGVTNTGGGGGGGPLRTGAGGSGIVVIRYPVRSVNGKVEYIPASNVTGAPTYTVSGGYRIYTFAGSGSITWTVT